MSARHFVTLGDLTPLGHIDTDHFLHPRRQVTVLLAVEHFDIHDFTVRTMWHPEAAILHVTELLTEDRPQELLLRRQLLLTFGRDLAHQDIERPHLGAHAHDTIFIQVPNGILRDVRDLARDLLGTQFGVPRRQFVLLDVHRGEFVLAHKLLTEQDGILKVTTLP